MVIYHSKNMLTKSKLDKSSSTVIYNCIYKFTCTCGSMYIGRTERRSSDRINEHVPKIIWMNTYRNYSSSIAKHFLETGHRVDTDKSFQVITRDKTTTLLLIVEAVAIQKFKPNLCTQNEMVVSLNLPWEW